MHAFTATERDALLAVKGIGPTVILRLEELGICTFKDLAQRDPEAICTAVSASQGASCWRNSPQARAAIISAISRAKQGL